MKLVYSGVSRVGQARKSNQDAILMRSTDRGALFLVADGIGGLEHGELVSNMLSAGYDRWWQERFLQQSDICFQSAISEIKNVLLEVNQEVIDRFGRFSAGSTLVLLFLFQGNCMCLSAGDSRIYLARKFSFRQITVDDIYENLRKPLTKSEEASRGKLVSAVGIRETPEFHIRTDVLRMGDRFFLCSDGVYRYLTPQKLSKRIRLGRFDAAQLMEDFSQEIEQNGARDNYSMICVRVNSL